MIVGNKVILREKRLSDARNDYEWESDPELAMLDAAPVVNITFSQYLEDYADEINHFFKTSRRFAIDTLEGKHIGNCSYYNINEARKDTELGIMIGDRDYWNNGYGADTVTTLVNHIFNRTKLNRVYLKTLESNDRAQKCFQKCGFTPYELLTKPRFRFALMEIHRPQWLEKQSRA
ncbi:MAG: GNAT family N-acetyltransferase [Dehalococcoidales bacterium]|nr:GNAT family N-acetyltransferase [Dehalococcoidales bacterium]MDZ4231003.1 GNAT family N-acetyltransferase [Dehalococcoidales bacterium]